MERLRSMDIEKVNKNYKGRFLERNNEEKVSYLNGNFVRIWDNVQRENYSLHCHSALEIILPVENYYEVTVDDKKYRIVPGEIFVVPAGKLHYLEAPETGKRFIFLFELSFLYKFKGYFRIQMLLKQPILISKETYPDEYDAILQTLIRMCEAYSDDRSYGELEIASLLIDVLITLMCAKSGNEDLAKVGNKRTEYAQKFEDILKHIELNYMEPMDVEQVASAVGLSRCYFEKMFKTYTGSTFYEYLCHRRVDGAMRLLRNTNLSVTEIALQSGFPSIATFNRLFKKYNNCSPREYRVNVM